MVRVLVGALLGAAVLFVWSAVSWMVIPWHRMEAIKKEDAVIRALRASDTLRGVYWIPGPPEGARGEEGPEARASWAQRHRDGPVAMMVYDPEGSEPMPLAVFFKGFALNFATALVAAILLAIAAPAVRGYAGRAFLVTLVGLYVGLSTGMASWNWMNYPLRYCLEMSADSAIGALLLGLVLAAVVRPRGSGGMSTYG